MSSGSIRASRIAKRYHRAIGHCRIPCGRSHVIDGPWQLLTNNVQLLLAVALEKGSVVFGPSFVSGESLYQGGLCESCPSTRPPT
jgi:hypothetical protein